MNFMMSIQDLCVQLLHEEEEDFVPMRVLYELVCQEREDFTQSFESFIELLRLSPNLFALIDSPVLIEESTDTSVLSESGVDFGVHVCLLERYADQEAYADFLNEYLHRMISSLEALWSTKTSSVDEDDPSISEIQNLLHKAYGIRDSLRNRKYIE